MTTIILALSIGYVFVLIILVLILITTSIPVVVRAGATALVLPLIFAVYWATGELRGFPTDSPLPDHFQMHWARIVEPDKITGDPGAIFLWIEELDDQNYPAGVPRAYRLPYSRELAEMVRAGNAQIAHGQPIAGEVVEEAPADDTSERLAEEIAVGEQRRSDVTVGERIYAPDLGSLRFSDLPAPVTPEKSR